MYLRASEMSKQAWSEAVKTNNLEEHMLLDPLYYSFGDKEQKCWGGASKCWGGCKTCWGGARMKLGGCAPPAPPQKIRQCLHLQIHECPNSYRKVNDLKTI